MEMCFPSRSSPLFLATHPWLAVDTWPCPNHLQIHGITGVLDGWRLCFLPSDSLGEKIMIYYYFLELFTFTIVLLIALYAIWRPLSQGRTQRKRRHRSSRRMQLQLPRLRGWQPKKPLQPAAAEDTGAEPRTLHNNSTNNNCLQALFAEFGSSAGQTQSQEPNKSKDYLPLSAGRP